MPDKLTRPPLTDPDSNSPMMWWTRPSQLRRRLRWSRPLAHQHYRQPTRLTCAADKGSRRTQHEFLPDSPHSGSCFMPELS